jgi:uncharacterized protein YjbI with pentapeptide repeats
MIERPPPDDVHYKVLATKAIWSVAAVIVLMGTGVAVWLLLAYGHGGDQARNQLEAIKTAGTVVVGAGGGVALLLAARRQRSAEIALKQKDREQAHQERDAAERRITDLYSKAADQLGSDKAPVRLAGLYALERVAQNNPEQRQTIVNVLCAYLRMPYADPDHEVRLTAQRLLTEHLVPDTPTFWADIKLDLTGAKLVDFDLVRCSVRQASFMNATFVGGAHFSGAIFTGRADFWMASFQGEVRFHQTSFRANTHFGKARFNGLVTFAQAIFYDIADFQSATFDDEADFRECEFECEPGTVDMLARGDAPYIVFQDANFAAGVPAEVAPYQLAR